MARQKGVQTLSGSLGGEVFYINKLYGPLVRMKGGATKDQIKNKDEFEGVRRNNAEFGRASSYAKTIRNAFHFLEKHCKEGTMHTNLGVRIRELLLLDTIHEWGQRDLDAKALEQFRHFELDVKSLSRQYFELPVETEAANGELNIYTGISLPKAGKTADAWKIRSVAIGIDLGSRHIQHDVKESDIYSFEKGSYGVGFRHYYDENLLLFHGMCIVFYRYDAVIDDYRPVKEEHVNAGFIRFVGR